MANIGLEISPIDILDMLDSAQSLWQMFFLMQPSRSSREGTDMSKMKSVLTTTPWSHN